MSRLTAATVRAALYALDLPGIADIGEILFRAPILRDGDGWLARVELPAGTHAQAVIERLSDLADALRVPVNQVHPAADPDNARHLDLRVVLDTV